MPFPSRKALYDDSVTLAAARAAFFERAGLGGDGGYGAAWVRVEAKPFPFFFPNTRGRVAAAKLHDLHHVATEYGADWPGEAEIAAWEIAGGCGPYAWAWVLNLGAFLVGMVLAPRRLFTAFVSGRRARNLYHEGFAEADVAAFIAWCAIAVLWHAALMALAVGAAVVLWSAIRR
jgi:hypothetical protein